MLYPISELARPLYFPVDLSRWWCTLNFGSYYESSELLDKTFKQQVCFSYYLIFLSLRNQHRLKNKIICYAEILIIETCYSLSKWHLAVQICTAGYVEYYLENLEKRFLEQNVTLRCNFLSSKLHCRCFSINITKFLEQLSLKHMSV